MRPARRTRLLGALAVVLALAGCGGGPSPEDTVEEFVQAAADGDYAQVCELLDPEYLDAVEAEGSSCAEVMADTAEEGSGSLIADADQLEVGEATVSEDEQSAMVETSYDGNEGAITLVKVDDEWRVSLAS